MKLNNFFKKYHEKIFFFSIYASYILYALVLFGLSTTAPKYLEYLKSFLKLYVSLFLLWRFNPLRKTKMTTFDQRVVFSCALFLLTTTTITEIVYRLISKF